MNQNNDPTYKIRSAESNEAPILSELALRSKGYWRYDAEFLADCRNDLTVTPTFIQNNWVFVIEKENYIAGFYGLTPSNDHNNAVEMEFLFVEPTAIGQGYGKQLWHHAIQTLTELGFQAIVLAADPNAVPFYQAMGAKIIGETPSSVRPNRMLPVMWYELPNRMV